MNPVFTALVPALQMSWNWWWDSGSGDTYGGHGGYGSGGGTWS